MNTNPYRTEGVVMTTQPQPDAQQSTEAARMGPCPGCDWFDPTPGITYADVSLMVRFMANEDYSTPDEIAYAVEKPWKHVDVLAEAKAWLAQVTS